MAKNFPFFKFIATDWLTGDIVYESFSAQGLFINICAVYWQRDGKLSLEDINRRYKNPPELLELIDRCFTVTDGYISIQFLDEQLEDANHVSRKNSDNGSKGGRPVKVPALGKLRLYLLDCELDGERFYKVGVTSETIARRFSNTSGATKKIPYNFSIVFDFEIDFELALSIESAIRDNYEQHIPVHKFSGHNECFKVSESLKLEIYRLANSQAITGGFISLTDTKPKKSKEEQEGELEEEQEKEGESFRTGKPSDTKKVSILEKVAMCDKRELLFYDSLKPFVSTYEPTMIRKFYDHWRERNKSKTRMKFELEDTWDVSLRLIKWESIDKKFNKDTKLTPILNDSNYQQARAKAEANTARLASL